MIQDATNMQDSVNSRDKDKGHDEQGKLMLGPHQDQGCKMKIMKKTCFRKHRTPQGLRHTSLGVRRQHLGSGLQKAAETKQVVIKTTNIISA